MAAEQSDSGSAQAGLPGEEGLASPFTTTLASLKAPLGVLATFDLICGVALALIGDLWLALAWAVLSLVCDFALQRLYARWTERPPEPDHSIGLSLLAAAGALRSLVLLSGPLVHFLISPSPEGFALTALMGLTSVALAVTIGWASPRQFAGMILVAPAVLILEAWVLLPPGPALGVSLGVVLFVGVAGRILLITRASVAAWRENQLEALAAVAEIQAARRRLRLAIDLTNVHVAEVDFVRRTMAVEGNSEAFFEQPLAFESYIQDPYIAVHEDDLPLANAAMTHSLETGAPYRLEHRIRRADGRLIWVDAKADMELDETGRPVRMIGALQDITHRKQIEEDLVRARDAAEAANRAKSEFLAIMSHEIRTPLNGVMGMVQAMARGELEPRQRDKLSVIDQSAVALLNVLNAILDIAKIESGRLELEIGELDISDIAQTTAMAYSAMAEERDTTLTVTVAPEARGLYRGDPGRVSQVLNNLVANALKFTLEARSDSPSADRTRPLSSRLRTQASALLPLRPRFSRSSFRLIRRSLGNLVEPGWAWPSSRIWPSA